VLTGDPDLAQDLVQDVMIRVQARWRKIEQFDLPEKYVRRAIANGYVSWRRRWTVRNLIPFGIPPDRGTPDPAHEETERSALWIRLESLPRRQRAVLVLLLTTEEARTPPASVAMQGIRRGVVRRRRRRAAGVAGVAVAAAAAITVPVMLRGSPPAPTSTAPRPTTSPPASR
jgi:DNA-directed RNA polymerase specialized sigma24 family protein